MHREHKPPPATAVCGKRLQSHKLRQCGCLRDKPAAHPNFSASPFWPRGPEPRAVSRSILLLSARTPSFPRRRVSSGEPLVGAGNQSQPGASARTIYNGRPSGSPVPLCSPVPMSSPRNLSLSPRYMEQCYRGQYHDFETMVEEVATKHPDPAHESGQSTTPIAHPNLEPAASLCIAVTAIRRSLVRVLPPPWEGE